VGGARCRAHRLRRAGGAGCDRRKRLTPSLDRPARPHTVYEQEIGTLSPAIADALARASALVRRVDYRALRLAAALLPRSWRYAAAILELLGDGRQRRWSDWKRCCAPRCTATPYDRFILRS
jgi:hypothetical protein